MQIKLAEPLSFIRQADLKNFYIEHRNGANLIVSGKYSQNIKASELELILSKNLLSGQAAAQVPAKPKTSKQLEKELKAAKAREDAEAQGQGAPGDEGNAGSQESGKAGEKL